MRRSSSSIVTINSRAVMPLPNVTMRAPVQDACRSRTLVPTGCEAPPHRGAHPTHGRAVPRLRFPCVSMPCFLSPRPLPVLPRRKRAGRGQSAKPVARSARLVAIGFEPIAVGIDNKGRIIVCAVVGAQPGLAIVAAAMADRGVVKGIDAFPRRGGEAKMQPGLRIGRNRTGAGADPESNGFLAVAERTLGGTQTGIADGLQCGVVECLGFRDVTNADGDMIDH